MSVIDVTLLQTALQREKVLIGNKYTGKAPYNNFHCSSIRLWNHPLVRRYIDAIESVQGCLRYGWLDANIHAMIIWVLARRMTGIRISTDTAFGYRHNTHTSTLFSLDVIANKTLKFIPSDEEDDSPTPNISLTLPAKLMFVTFANTDYMSTGRIEGQAREFGVFDEIRACSEHTIPEFLESHREFIRSVPRGYGLWIWKPKLILTMLETMNENDILVYCDAGMYLNRHGLKRFAEYIEMIKPDEKCVVAFSLNDGFTADAFACPDAVTTYFPDFYKNTYRYCYAGVFLIKKTSAAIQLIKDWLSLCENYSYLQGDSVQKHDAYLGGDADNGLWNLCMAKHDTHILRIYPDETNIYFTNGTQFYGCPDWSSLKAFPFHCRRIRPAKD